MSVRPSKVAEPAPLPLVAILELTDPADRLAQLAAYLDRLAGQQQRARDARLATVRDLRASGATWRALSAQTGLSEQYLRAAVKGQP